MFYTPVSFCKQPDGTCMIGLSSAEIDRLALCLKDVILLLVNNVDPIKEETTAAIHGSYEAFGAKA